MKITIAIPCYNSEKWVKVAVESALEQDYEDVEVIAIDNESTDSTYKILLDIKKQYPNLIIDKVPNIYRHSWDEPRERALELFSGDYITFLCSDDFLEKDYIKNISKILKSSNGVIKAMQSPIRNIKNSIPQGFQAHKYSSLIDMKEGLLFRSLVNTPTVVYSREIYEKGMMKTYPEKYYGAADYDLYCRMADNNILIYPFPQWIGYNYRWHEEQATWGMHKEPIKYDKLIQEYWRKKWKK